MTGFILFVLALIGSVLFMQWRARVAGARLIGTALPENAPELPQHPDGILLLFHHPRCSPCKQAIRQLDAIEAQATNRVLKIDVSEQPEFTQAMGIRATPTTLFIKNNSVSKAFVGAISQKKLLTLLKLG